MLFPSLYPNVGSILNELDGALVPQDTIQIVQVAQVQQVQVLRSVFIS